MSDQPSAVIHRFGDSGSGVRAIRDWLRASGDLAASACGDEYDEATTDAVRAFQQRRGLLVDGIVGPQTYVVLHGAHWQLGDRVLGYIPGHQHQGDDVAQLQERLLSLGLSPERVDGIFGANTERAVRRFQRGVGLPEDGTVGPMTLRAFGDLSRSVAGGSPHVLRERELVRQAGHSLSGRTIVLDPGHGGAHPGSRNGDLVEADLMLDLARRVEGRLTAVGVTVLFTRGSDTCPDELERAETANRADADLLLSLHCDSTEQQQASGVATFFYGQDRFGAWSAIGEHLAGLIQREVVARSELTDCRSHARSWTILQRTTMPAVRVEAGYLSHPHDAARLADPAFRDTLAECLVVAVQRTYLGEDDMSTTGMLRFADLKELLRSKPAQG